jgi:hypothetical protein
LSIAIVQASIVGHLAWQLASETKMGRRHLHPSPGNVLCRGTIKRGIDFDREKRAGIKFQPAIRWAIWRIEWSAPFLETPSTGPKANFLLLDQLQSKRRIVAGIKRASHRLSIGF